MMKFALIVLFLAANPLGCLNKEQIVEPVTDIDSENFFGEWYEIARLGNGLDNATMTYSSGTLGRITVERRGFNAKTGETEALVGSGKFVDGKTTGHISVSFRQPIYRDFVIFDVDKANYLYAYVSDGSKDALWLLARQPRVNDVRKKDFVTKSKALGFDTSALIWVDHSKKEKPSSP